LSRLLVLGLLAGVVALATVSVFLTFLLLRWLVG
jgi:hypothetical protein